MMWNPAWDPPVSSVVLDKVTEPNTVKEETVQKSLFLLCACFPLTFHLQVFRKSSVCYAFFKSWL